MVILGFDIGAALTPDVNLLESVVRGVVMYLFIFGVVLVTTIVASSFVVDWLAYRFPSVGLFVHPERKPLIVDSRIIRPTLRGELMTEDELMTQLRLNGVEELSEVKAAYLEGNGAVSVIKRAGSDPSPRSSKAAAPATG